MGSYIALKEFEKAFESIEWAFLLKCLKVFNFGKQFISSIKILFTDIKSQFLIMDIILKLLTCPDQLDKPVQFLLFFIRVAEILAINIQTEIFMA